MPHKKIAQVQFSEESIDDEIIFDREEIEEISEVSSPIFEMINKSVGKDIP